MNENTIGKRIQALRKERGLTQKQLADAVGVTPQAVSKWETDESCPDITALPLLAGALGVSVDALLGGEGAAEVKTGIVRDAGETAREGGKTEKAFVWDWSAGRIPAIFLGVFILLAGVLLILMKTNAEWFGEIGFWDVVWPSAIIFVGLSGCCSRDISGFSHGITAAGVIFLLRNIGVIKGEGIWTIILAIVLVFVGLSIILHQFFRRHRKRSRVKFSPGVKMNGKSGKFKSEYSDADGFINYNASFGDDRIVCRAEKIVGGKVNVSFGEFTLDLRGVSEFGENASLDLNVSFGDAEVLLPKNVRAELATAGSFSGKGVTGMPDPDAPYVLRVNAAVSFGGLSIKYDD